MNLNLDIYTDGASRKNPGQAGAGIFIKHLNGEIIAEIARYLGITTNNEAEYMAFIIALEYLLNEFKIDDDVNLIKINFYSDSQLLIRQINGQYSVKSPNILPLHKKASELINKLNKKNSISVNFSYIPREHNKQADRLANIAIDNNIP
ncbi:MAG: ribonuclease HI family protein [Candidatus Acididesulfobacter diazotrophicus]|jgi:ribonuclease HI|uniref:Ribonuclease HI family protein n=1 Tax=Candidatus Acididesulfobacter diazotrophicus TaxID=2597226 RepID=A0A519BQK5_9DELT|nr:MAG: ribonuclease HI family protein [Candidatus Acididesulfobacter diazotrophicus]